MMVVVGFFFVCVVVVRGSSTSPITLLYPVHTELTVHMIEKNTKHKNRKYSRTMNQLNQWIKRFINGDSTNLKYYIGIGVCCVFAVGNYLRVRSSRCKDRSIVVEAKTKKNVAIVFLPGTAYVTHTLTTIRTLT